eukprot:Lithocolla_globosa_v1_NODE_6637_length_1057_cov_1.913174.p1 type:complete len:198 gc:universal NODE_6637_length_1057_cov_1.913174:330-923(+)
MISPEDTRDQDETSPREKSRHSLCLRGWLVFVLVASGCTMTIAMKYQDEQCLQYLEEEVVLADERLCANFDPQNDPSPDPSLVIVSTNPTTSRYPYRYFNQPFLQLFHLGLGQIVSVAFSPLYTSHDVQFDNLRQVPFRRFFPSALLASLFDCSAELFIIFGLHLTFASVTEMLKTTLVVAVALLSIFFFKVNTLSP